MTITSVGQLIVPAQGLFVLIKVEKNVLPKSKQWVIFGQGLDMNKKYLKGVYECYNDEVDQVWEEYEEGKITSKQRDVYLDNLARNLQSDLDEVNHE